MQDELVPLEDETGEFDDSYVAAAPADGLGSVLVILTSIFLLISIVMVVVRLYGAYDIGKGPEAIRERQKSVRGK